MLALCRICKNITDPANGLVLNKSAQCLPLLSGQNNDLSCLLSEVWRYRSYQECRDMFHPNSDSPLVAAHFGVDDSTTDQTHSLRYLSMAFRSVSLECIHVYVNPYKHVHWKVKYRYVHCHNRCCCVLSLSSSLFYLPSLPPPPPSLLTPHTHTHTHPTRPLTKDLHHSKMP